MRRAIVDCFGVEGLADVRALRRVYAQLIKVHRPETAPERFSEIHALYLEAKAALERGETVGEGAAGAAGGGADAAAGAGRAADADDDSDAAGDDAAGDHDEAGDDDAAGGDDADDADDDDDDDDTDDDPDADAADDDPDDDAPDPIHDALAERWAEAIARPDADAALFDETAAAHPDDARPWVARLALACRRRVDPKPLLLAALASPAGDAVVRFLAVAGATVAPLYPALTVDEVLALLPRPGGVAVFYHWWKHPTAAGDDRDAIATALVDDPRAPADLATVVAIEAAEDAFYGARPEAARALRGVLARRAPSADLEERLDALLWLLDDLETHAAWSASPTGRALLVWLRAAREMPPTARRALWWALLRDVPVEPGSAPLPPGRLWPLVLSVRADEEDAPREATADICDWMRAREALFDLDLRLHGVGAGLRLLAWVVAWTAIVVVMRFYDHLPEWLPGVVFVAALTAVWFFNRKVMPRIARRLIERWWLWPTLARYLRDTGHLPGELHRAAAMLDLGWLNAPFARRTIEDWTSTARSETTR